MRYFLLLCAHYIPYIPLLMLFYMELLRKRNIFMWGGKLVFRGDKQVFGITGNPRVPPPCLFVFAFFVGWLRWLLPGYT